ncbi:restriction endonuclease [Bacillus horti]|uniref:AAA+ ATPase domain-containing protein n=1 Tax=Caldalkalibacillus horti TaxID=77523 RepID=A0ABT9VZ94_9BACI|nr:restriction endonuclease [Bacillus horti]MDQ0166142.1 hypothetical protein [Bacillus horti]
MSNYDFHALLDPLDFEKLVCDIISLRDGISLRMYKEGRDDGVDGLYTNNNNITILQAKRYQSNFSSLFRSLKLELPKVRKLQPDHYILGISMELSKPQVDKIITLFKEFNVSPHDILDTVELNRLLKQPAYKEIISNFPKLWAPNANILEKILKESLHSGIYKESAMELKIACQKTKTFVPTKIYHQALKNWSHNHVIILSGEPGAGKTSMAQTLALSYLQPDSFNGYVWANSIEDIYNLLEDNQKQVFILDDFWGSIFLGKHNSRKDEDRLDKLIKHIVEFHDDKRLILTTREYILQQGFQKHPQLKGTLEQYALICTMEEYSDDEKASILYSHLYTSNLDYEYVHYLYMETRQIVDHQNYNPRVLSLFLNKKFDNSYSPEEYFYQLCDYFDCPDDFWKTIFLDLSTEAQFVAMLLLITSTPVHRGSIEQCYQKYIHFYSSQMSVKNLGDCVIELEKTMITSVYSDDFEDILLKFSLPAVQDFLFAHLKENCEQWVPKLLACCSYYNQLQFLLEYLSKHCSDTVNDLIIQQCIMHYHDYAVSLIEYDGSWNWDYESIEERDGRLDRFLNLLRIFNAKRHPKLCNFLEGEINHYCLTMGKGDLLEEQYNDLYNLPDIIVRCIEIGMNFNGQELIISYYKNAFSAHHYSAMQKFQKVFPDEYVVFHKKYYPKIRKELKNIILSELELLVENYMPMELDMLIDSIPDLLKEFNLRYTKEFGKKVYSMCGREPSLKNSNVKPYKPLHGELDWDEKPLEIVKDDAGKWLFGPQETYLDDDEINNLISKSNLLLEVKEKLIKALDNTTIPHINNLLQTQESIDLFIRTLYSSEPQILEKESHIYLKMLFHIVEGDSTLLQKLIGFCAEGLSIFIYYDEPVIRKNLFLKDPVYETYLKNDEKLRETVFQYLIMEDDQWIYFSHVPLFIFCFASVICYSPDAEDSEEFYPSIWGDNFYKFKKVVWHTSKKQTSILYADFGPYNFKNFEWEACMYRLFEELNPKHFNEIYVAPVIKRYLNELGDGDNLSRLLKHISLSGLIFEYKKSGAPDSLICELSDELSMIEHLGISEIWGDVFPVKTTKAMLVQLKKDGIVHQYNNKWSVAVHKITDVELLKTFGVYDAASEFISKVTAVHNRFETGDYSFIKRLS